MSNGAIVLAEPVRQFVDEVTAVLAELGKGSSPTGTLERDAALEAQAIAAAVIASDGRYSDAELRAFAVALSPWFDSRRRRPRCGCSRTSFRPTTAAANASCRSSTRAATSCSSAPPAPASRRWRA